MKLSSTVTMSSASKSRRSLLDAIDCTATSNELQKACNSTNNFTNCDQDGVDSIVNYYTTNAVGIIR